MANSVDICNLALSHLGADRINALTDNTRQAIWDAVQSLEPSLREVVVLRYYLDMSGSEIAEVTGAPPGTVYWRLHRAREALEPLLSQDDTLADEVAERDLKTSSGNQARR